MARSITLAFAVCFALGTAALADVGPVEIMSRTDPTLVPEEGGQESAFPPSPGSRVSADGRFVVFESLAANLASGQIDTNRTWDVFLHDRETGETVLASGTAEAPRRAGNAASGHPTLSADGRFVLFTSFASDLAAPGDAHPIHAFVYDRVANTTTLVGPTNAAPQRVCCFDPSASAPRISDDGRFVAFQSNADDVIPGQVEVGHFYDLFLFDRENGTTTLVSHAPGLPTTSSGAPAGDPSISADGRFVAFSMDGVYVHDRLTGENSLGYSGSLPEISANGTAVVFVDSQDVFVYDLPTAAVSLVSRRSGAIGLPANGASFVPSISADGRRISFLSRATDLVSGVTDLNDEIDVFVFDRDTGSMTLASRASGTPLRTANGRSLFPRISADGRFVAFETRATDLLPGGDANGALEDVFLFDRIAGTTVLVSAAGFSDVFASPNTGNGRSRGPQLSADGGVVAFGSAASNLLRENRELNAVADVYLYDRAARLRTAASVRAPDLPCWTGAGESQVSALSADGRYVAFVSTAGNLVPGQYVSNGTSDVFLRDRQTGTTVLVSHQAIFPGDPPSTIEGDGSSYSPAVSGNGRYVAFTSFATYLTFGQVDTNFTSDVFLYDRHTGATILLSHAAGSPAQAGNSASFLPTISANGRYVTYLSFASDLVPGDGSPDSTPDLYLYDRVTGTTKLISHASGAPTQRADNQTVAAVISANGRAIVFASEATDLVAGVTDVNFGADVFAYEISSGNVSLVTRSASNPGATADVDCGPLAISADGRSAAFLCRGTDLVPGQVEVDPGHDTYLADLGSGQVVLVSHAASSPTQTGDGRSDGSPSISGDGRYVVFASTARDLITGQTEPAGYPDVFLYDRSSGQVTRVTTSAAAPQAANHASYAPVISENGRTIAFLSLASDLVPGQIDPVESMDVFVYDVRAGTIALANWAGTPVTPGRGLVWNVLALSADGAALGFSSDALDLVPFDFNGRSDAFVVPIG